MLVSARFIALGSAIFGLSLIACAPKGNTNSPEQAQADSTPAAAAPEEQPAPVEGEPAAPQSEEAPAEAIAAMMPPPSVELKTGATCPNGAKAGESWKVDCNTCTCSDKGEMQCTLKACMPPEGQQEGANSCPEGVKIGESWKEACNTCRCDEAGYPVCTLKACAP